ncbi:LysM peptidoglycan-binding domain-containing protein [Paenibacillus sp. LHD-117]|uniref:LysM peptidoglycan-binding domain-containing protein n=1 Tax=Paenibacillus sp. LHD-117 TaxID=3071412 RepID=UPI0027E1DD59|nr:LysM peptidoglycan-binding domain-containing protein [Paenibacillus sp. LHD-117]MDQ6419559.1 LysM peptidoglycan-binding domain-containing protein [Paenibacillus sp. LHD-117]
MSRQLKWVVSLITCFLLLAVNPGLSSATGGQEETSISIYYGVKAGDTLYGISKRHYLTGDFERVARLNGLDPKAKLQAGVRLKLSNPLVLDHYTVKQGDTLFAIASKYFSRSNYISIMMQYNKMSSTQDLKAGMTLRIPLPAGESRHQVQAGETLFSISSKYYKLADYQGAIARSNGIESAAGAIKAGQALQIPNPFFTSEIVPAGNASSGSSGGVRSIEIDIAKNKLYVKSGGKIEKSFDIASGKQKGQTPTGTFEIMTKLNNPWYSSKGIPGGDPKNPLGSRWLGLSVANTQGTKYGIHGTNAPESIGTNASAGCIRMLNADVEWLFSKIPTGTKVVIHA